MADDFGYERVTANGGEYGPSLVNDFAVDFIARRAAAARQDGRPFFLYDPMILTHDPFQPTPDSPDWDPQAVGEQVSAHPRHFADMTAFMDGLVGRLLDTLAATGVRDDTPMLFLGDNGTAGIDHEPVPRRGLPRRDWIYSWYHPRANADSGAARESAFDARHKLYADGTFYDLVADPDETTAIPQHAWSAEQSAAATLLRAASAGFADARARRAARPAQSASDRR